MAERTLNARQLEVLQWVVEGCPAGVMTDATHKTTARALHKRHLVRVSRRGGVWKAEATEAGRHFVKHGQYPAGYWTTGAEDAVPATRAPRSSSDRRKVTGLRPVDLTINDLIESGGEMTVEAIEDGYWEGLAASANRYQKVPDGKVLKVERGATWNERVVRLEHPPEWMSVALVPIPVADQLHRPHPAVMAVRDDRNQLPMTGETRNRALRILDALAKAALARGYEVDASSAESTDGWPQGHLTVTIRGQSNAVAIDEPHRRVPHTPTARELRDKDRHSWAYIPTHDELPSGRLRLNVIRGWTIRQAGFVDTKTVALEDRLPVVLHELELRAAAREERDRREELERQQRERERQRARDDAEIGAREAHRGKVLIRELEQWQHAKALDAYLQAMADRIEELQGGEQLAAKEWLRWARQHQSRVDPLRRSLELPPDPEFTAEALAPFLGPTTLVR